MRRENSAPQTLLRVDKTSGFFIITPPPKESLPLTKLRVRCSFIKKRLPNKKKGGPPRCSKLGGEKSPPLFGGGRSAHPEPHPTQLFDKPAVLNNPNGRGPSPPPKKGGKESHSKGKPNVKFTCHANRELQFPGRESTIPPAHSSANVFR